jgi:hypothetical protein
VIERTSFLRVKLRIACLLSVVALYACAHARGGTEAKLGDGYVFPSDSGYFRFVGNRIEGAFPRDTQDINNCAYEAWDPQTGKKRSDGSRTIRWDLDHQFHPPGMHNDNALRASVVIDVPPGRAVTEEFLNDALRGASLDIRHDLGQMTTPIPSAKPAVMFLQDGRLTFTITDSNAVQHLISPRNVSLRYSWCGNGRAKERQIPIEYKAPRPSPKHGFSMSAGGMEFLDSSATHASLVVFQRETGDQDFRYLRSQTFIPPSAPVDWLGIDAYRIPTDVMFVPWIATSVQANANVIVFLAHSDSTGKIAISSVRAGRPGEIESVAINTIGNVPACAVNKSWIAAFFIEGIGHIPKDSVRVYANTAPDTRLSFLLDPKRNVLKMKPAIEFHTHDLRTTSSRYFTVLVRNPFVKTKTNQTIFMVMNHSADGWAGGAEFNAPGRTSSTTVSTSTSSPLDPWRVYNLIDPNYCPK